MAAHRSASSRDGTSTIENPPRTAFVSGYGPSVTVPSVAAALDGVCFVDGTVAEHGLSPAVPPEAPAKSIPELQARIEAASREPEKLFARWAAEDEAAQEEADREDPPAAARRKKDNDWSDV